MESERSPIRHKPIGVVILATEPIALEPVVARWLPFVERAAAGSQLIVVADVPVEEVSPRPRLRIVRHTQPLGIGSALQTSIWSVMTPLVMFVPADGSFAPDQMEPFLVAIDKADAVVGCRRAEHLSPTVPLWDFARGLGARIFLGARPESRVAWPGWSGWRRRFVARRVFGVNLTDPESGVLLAQRSLFDRIPIQSSGSFAWVEALAKANHLGCLFDEIAIDGPPRPAENFSRDAPARLPPSRLWSG